MKRWTLKADDVDSRYLNHHFFS